MKFRNRIILIFIYTHLIETLNWTKQNNKSVRTRILVNKNVQSCITSNLQLCVLYSCMTPFQ